PNGFSKAIRFVSIPTPIPRIGRGDSHPFSSGGTMKSLRNIFFLVAMAAALAVPAVTQAQVKVIQTNCTPVSTDPPLVEVTFAVLNLGPIPVCSIHLTPVTIGASNADSCKILQCSSAPGWTCQLTPGGGA